MRYEIDKIGDNNRDGSRGGFELILRLSRKDWLRVLNWGLDILAV